MHPYEQPLLKRIRVAGVNVQRSKRQATKARIIRVLLLINRKDEICVSLSLNTLQMFLATHHCHDQCSGIEFFT